MRVFETIPHTADIGLRVEADTIVELFLGALMGMGEILRRGVCESSTPFDVARRIEVSSIDESSLLIDFLNEALAAASEEHAIFCEVDFDSLSNRRLVARIRGRSVDGFDREIKAVTYHGSAIIRNEAGNLETRVLFDI
jgi:SHS2 domain-containing protein